MRNLPLYIALSTVSLLSSCKKSNSGGGSGTSSPSYLSTAVSYGLRQRIVDSFYYDTLHRLDTVTQSIYDTSTGNLQFNTWMVQFIYDNTRTSPSYYNYFDIPLGGYGDYHLLSYDPNDRLVKDSSYSGSDYVAYYSYPQNKIVSTILFEGTAAYNMIDTLSISGGNIGTEVIYLPEIPGQPDVLQADIQFTAAPTANPAFHEAIGGSIGPLLLTLQLNANSDFVDFISKDAFDKASGLVSTATPGLPVDYVLSTDARERLTKLTAAAGGADSIVYHYY